RLLVGPDRALAGPARLPARRARGDPVLRGSHRGPPRRGRVTGRTAVLVVHRQHHRDAAPSGVPTEHSAGVFVRRSDGARASGPAHPTWRGSRARPHWRSPGRAAPSIVAGRQDIARALVANEAAGSRPAAPTHIRSPAARRPRSFTAPKARARSKG